jgi:hypothetical protein
MAVSMSVASQAQSPYAGEQAREIKYLSDSEIEGYLAGSGMGYAKAAELNRYPGPKHVLELAKEIALSDEQHAQTQKLYHSMNLAAVKFGRLLVMEEQALDEAFADESITAEYLKTMLAEIARLEGEIRYVHLEAHLQQKQLLSQHQAHQYEILRGYESGDAGHRQRHDH